ncbi:PAS domain-containing hybrid sensor histidine kinase/response regulator [Thalassovita aquimarina]|uniref:PAS domain-containing hybrid sensor histidine kinase/response regulator n=1 Tax=Thalassovita aquimarina TaxID=2785917 RepID=UPI003566A34D
MTKIETVKHDDSLARYADIIALDVYPCYLLTVDGKVVFSNGAAERLCPADQFEIGLRTWPQNAEFLRRSAKSTNPKIGRMVLQQNDGESFGIRGRMARLPARSAVPLVLARLDPGDVEDQYQRLRSESSQLQRAIRARKRSDKRFRQFLDSAVDGIGAVASNGRFTMANSSLSKMLGVTDLIGKSLFSYVDMGAALHGAETPFEAPADPGAFLEKVSGTPLEVYVESVEHDRYPVEVTFTPTDEPGSRQFVVVMRDITARTEYRDALDRSQYLEAARDIARANEQSKTRFLATVSHEMRTPLGAIATAVDLLFQNNDLKPEQRQLMELIRGSSDTALEQINNTLEHVRMDMRPIKDHPVSSFNPSQVLTRLANQSWIAAEAKGLELRLALDCQSDQQVAGYHHLFQRVVQNLMGNAVKYTDTGHITLTARCDRVTKNDGKKQFLAIEMSVADTGKGIAADEIDRLFDPFETGNSDYNSLAQSAGLGLSIVKRAVDAMGGSIRVSSTVGAGTEFRVSLSFAIPDAAVKSASDETEIPAPETKGFRVLVVDDNPLNRDLMVKLLHSEGCIPHCADSGEAALEAIRTNDVDAVLMDVGLPGIDGLEATRQLLAQPGHADMPVFGLTGFSDSETRERAGIAGMEKVYMKPLRRPQLYEIIHRVRGSAPPAPDMPEPGPIPDLLDKSVSRQIAKIAGENWSVFVHQLHKECLTTLDHLRNALDASACDDIVEMSRKASVTVTTVGAVALNQNFLEIEELAQKRLLDDLPVLLDATEHLLEETRLALAML